MIKKYLSNTDLLIFWNLLKENYDDLVVGDETSLTTNSKTVVGAINELHEAISLRLAKILQDIEIIGENIVTTATSTYTASPIPVTATFSGVTWSITPASSYATINSKTGVLTVKNTAWNDDITIKAVSKNNLEIYKTKTVNVSYPLTLEINGSDTISGDYATYTLSCLPVRANITPTWSIISGNSYASINSSGVVSVELGTVNKEVVIQAYEGVTKTITVSNPVVVTINGNSSVNGEEAQYTVSYTPASANLSFTWSITSGSSYASIDNTGKLTVVEGTANKNVTIKATSTVGNYSATKTVTVTNVAGAKLLWDVDLTGSSYKQYDSAVMAQNSGLTTWTMLVYANSGNNMAFMHLVNDGANTNISSNPQTSPSSLNIHSYGNWSSNNLVFSLKGTWIEGGQWNAGNNKSICYAITRNGSTIKYSTNGTSWTTVSGSTWNTTNTPLTVGANGAGDNPMNSGARVVLKLYESDSIDSSIITDFINTYK